MSFGEPLASGGSFLTGTTIRDCFTYEDLGPEDQAIAAAAEDFVRREVLPQVDAIETQAPGVMRGLLQKAGELGLLMFVIPTQHGGLGVSKAGSTLILKANMSCMAWWSSLRKVILPFGVSKLMPSMAAISFSESVDLAFFTASTSAMAALMPPATKKSGGTPLFFFLYSVTSQSFTGFLGNPQ